MDLTWVDLCSGLGGASQPALDRGWKVVRIDIDPRFNPDIVADVRNLISIPPCDMLWASPPCQEFSKWGLRCFYPDPPEPDLSISLAVKRIIDEHSPRFWVVENVWASRPWLSKLFGPIRAMPPGHALWSNLGFLLPNIQPHKGCLGHGLAKRWGSIGVCSGGGKNGERRNTAESAVIPYEIGETICRAVENHKASVCK